MKKRFSVFIGCIIFFIIVEIFLGYLFWIRKTGMSSTTFRLINRAYSCLHPRQDLENIDVSFYPGSMYVPDKYLGYSDVPGSYTVTLTDKTSGKQHSFVTTINKKGNRITSFTPELFEGKKEIWIFGDSLAYGWGNNDETTFPFFLQQFLLRFRVVNYADGGYGNIHEYLQLKRELENNLPPEIIVIVYGTYFNDRNVAAPTRLKRYKYNDAFWQIDAEAFLHPKASLSNGELEIEYVPLFWDFHKASDDKDPGKEYQYEVTKKILSEIYNLGDKNGAGLILAFISGTDSDKVVSYAKKIGYFISDLRPKDDKREYDNFMPFDVHPGPLAQNNYARKLYKSICEYAKS